MDQLIQKCPSRPQCHLPDIPYLPSYWPACVTQISHCLHPTTVHLFSPCTCMHLGHLTFLPLCQGAWAAAVSSPRPRRSRPPPLPPPRCARRRWRRRQDYPGIRRPPGRRGECGRTTRGTTGRPASGPGEVSPRGRQEGVNLTATSPPPACHAEKLVF